MKFLSNLIILFFAIPLSTYAVDFKKYIKPLLESRCISCHSSTKQKGDLNLSTLLASTKGGDSGAAVTPNNPDASLLIERISEGIVSEFSEAMVSLREQLPQIRNES